MNSYYTICITSFVWIRTKISEKKICIRVGISTPDQNGLQSSQRHATHHPTSSISAHFIYIPYNKITIRKSGLYDFSRMAYLLTGDVCGQNSDHNSKKRICNVRTRSLWYVEIVVCRLYHTSSFRETSFWSAKVAGTEFWPIEAPERLTR